MRPAFVGLAMVVALAIGPATRASPAPFPSTQSDSWPVPTWTTMTLSGSEATLCRIAGVSNRVEPGRLTLELVRLLYGETLAGDVPVDRTRTALLAYLDSMDAFNRAVAASHLAELSRATIARARVREARLLLALLGIAFDPNSSTPWRDLTVQTGAGERNTQSKDAASASLDRSRILAVRQSLAEAGLPIQNLVARLNDGQTVALTLPRTTLPLPLSPDVWRDALIRAKVADEGLFSAIIRNRGASLMYHGLLALDGETLVYFGNHPGLLSTIARRYPGAFAASARSIRIRSGRVDAPGGSAAAALWADLVGARPDSADDFIRALLGHEAGVTAYFYDALAHLDAPHLAFALGADRLRFRALHAAFSGVEGAGQIEAHPFTRPIDDGPLLLAQLAVDPTGRLAAPASAVLCARESDVPNPSIQAAPDAASIAEIVLRPAPAPQRRRRFEAVLFAQRVFSHAVPAQLADVCAAVHGFARLETLALTLERMGVDDPALYSRAMRYASRLSDLDSPRRVATALSQFQGALAVLDRLVSQKVLDSAEAARLVDSLTAVPITEHGYRGALVDWMQTQCMATLRTRLPGSATDTEEDLLLLGLAGTPPAMAVSQLPIEWEEQAYRIDTAAAELDRLLHVRRRQGGNRLDDALALRTAARELTGAVQPAQARHVAGQIAARIKSVTPPEYAGIAGVKPGESMERLADAARNLERAPDSGPRKASLADAVNDVADEVAGDVLRSLAYAVAIGDPESNLLLGSNMAAEHDFGVASGGANRLLAPWALPTQQAGSGVAWHLAGSLLALDVPLARFSLRRISGDFPLHPTRLDPDDEEGLAHAAVLMRAWSLSDAGRDRLVALVARGRQEAAAAATPAQRVAILSAINATEWRRNVLAWEAIRREARPFADALTLSELLWIGARAQRMLPPDQWGPSTTDLTGCLCQRFAAPATVDTFGVRPSGGLLASLLSDITLRVAELTSEARLPAALVPPLLLGVIEDVLDSAQPAHADDWIELAATAREISRERFEDQVSALTVAGGPLVPVNKGS